MVFCFFKQKTSYDMRIRDWSSGVCSSDLGKTTLLTLVTGLEAPDAGTISVLGRSDRLNELPWSDVALLPQSLGLLDELTIVENIALPLRLGTEQPGDDVAELMERLGIDHLADRFPDEVSLGEQQRTALARAAVVRPRVLVADEPISHQNQERSEEHTSELHSLMRTSYP